jgi:nucleoside-diphosphate-sugar epimerase
MKRFENKNVIVTGASGYIGTKLVHALKEEGAKVWGMSSKGGDHFEHIPVDWSNFFFDEAHMPDHIDYVFSLAAQTSAYKANENPIEDYDHSVKPLLNLLEYLKEKKQKPHIVLASSSTIHGIPNEIPVNEGHHPAPVTIYDLHKYFSELYLFHYIDEGTVTGHALRLCNIYGPGVESSSKDRGIIHFMAGKAFRGEELPVYGNGEEIRDYLYIDDLIEAMLVGAFNKEKTNGLYFVMGSGTGYKLKDAFNTVIDLAKEINPKTNSILKHVDPPQGLSPIEKRNFVADTKLFTALTGWTPKVSFEEGIKAYLHTLNDNEGES